MIRTEWTCVNGCFFCSHCWSAAPADEERRSDEGLQHLVSEARTSDDQTWPTYGSETSAWEEREDHGWLIHDFPASRSEHIKTSASKADQRFPSFPPQKRHEVRETAHLSASRCKSALWLLPSVWCSTASVPPETAAFSDSSCLFQKHVCVITRFDAAAEIKSQWCCTFDNWSVTLEARKTWGSKCSATFFFFPKNNKKIQTGQKQGRSKQTSNSSHKVKQQPTNKDW